MMKKLVIPMLFVMGMSFFAPHLQASKADLSLTTELQGQPESTYAKQATASQEQVSDNKQDAAKEKPGANDTNAEQGESLLPGKTLRLSFSHFTWGAEVGSSLDLTSHDLSTFDADVVFGYKNSFFKIAGLGAGIHRSIHNGNNLIPVYVVMRSSFRSKPSLCFLNLQAGYSFNTLRDSQTVGDIYGVIGLGINLQKSSLASSYVMLNLSYQNIKEANAQKLDFDTHHVFFANLVIGINF